MGISHLLNRSISLERFAGYGTYAGEYTYSAAETVPARIVKKNKQTRSETGEEVVSTCQITVETSVTTKDKITLPTGETPDIISVESFDDYTTFHHTVIYT